MSEIEPSRNTPLPPAFFAIPLRPCFAGLDREQFLVCCLDAKNVSIGVNIVRSLIERDRHTTVQKDFGILTWLSQL